MNREEDILRGALAFLLSQRSMDPGVRRISFKALKEAYPLDFPWDTVVEHDAFGDAEFEKNLRATARRMGFADEANL